MKEEEKIGLSAVEWDDHQKKPPNKKLEGTLVHIVEIIFTPLAVVGTGVVIFLLLLYASNGISIFDYAEVNERNAENLEKYNFLKLQNPHAESYGHYQSAIQLTGGITACDQIKQGELLREPVGTKSFYTVEELKEICRKDAKELNPNYLVPGQK